MNHLKQMITEIEKHTGEKFDINKRRHFFHLSKKIERLHSRELRQLAVIKNVLNGTEHAPSIYDDSTHYVTKRR